MPTLARALAACLALSLILLGGCRDRHEPIKPTVAASAAR